MRPLLALFLLAPLASAQTFTETFDGASNTGGWSWGTGNQTFSPVNGNPGAFLQDLTLVTCCPTLSTAPGSSSVFTGNYRAMNVSSVGIDLITLDADFGVGGRPLTVMLVNDAGTPTSGLDDYGAYFIGSVDIPDAGVPAFTPAGWTSFDFAIDAQSDTLPTGWTLYRADGTAPTHDWREVVSDVDRLQYFYGDPTLIFLVFGWDVGADNARIAMSGAFPRNGSGVNPACFSSLTPPALGTTWQTQVDASVAASPSFSVVLVHASPSPPIVLATGELLIDLTSARYAASAVVSSGALDAHGFTLPPDPSFAGASASCQAFLLGAQLDFCNALDVVLGF